MRTTHVQGCMGRASHHHPPGLLCPAQLRGAKKFLPTMPQHLVCYLTCYLTNCVGAGAQSALTSNLSRWMLVPNSMVNLDGSQCNMVGTGYTAFYAQSVSFYWPKQGVCQTEVLLSKLMHNGNSCRLKQLFCQRRILLVKSKHICCSTG